jgi:serine/threonine-protein kinase
MNHADRNLLFGILALQMEFVSRDALIAAMHAWVLEKTRALESILVEQGALSETRRQLLEQLVDEHLRAHDGDAEKSLAAAPAISEICDVLRQIDDPLLNGTLARLSSVDEGPRNDPERTTDVAAASALDSSRFMLLRPHAQGGLGQVSVALDVELNREVALKELRPDRADDPASRSRFLMEAEITGRLEHPGIVPVYALGKNARGQPYYAMRFVKGESLKEAIAQFHSRQEESGHDIRQWNLGLRQLLGRFLDVCDAIAYAHSRGVLHRDLKPSNIMLGPYGETLVVDWGLAKSVDRPESPAGDLVEMTLRPSSGSGIEPTQMGSAVGSPSYMSPEQAEGRLTDLGPTTDVYSLGATLYCLMTGKAPFEGEDVGLVLRQVRQGDFPPPRRLAPLVPPALEAICLKAMAAKPGDRYPSAKALAKDVERWLADEPVSAMPERGMQRLARWLRRHRTRARAAVVALVLVTLVSSVSALLLNRAWRGAEAATARERAARGDADAAVIAEKQQRERAEGNLQVARQVVEEMYGQVSEELGDQKEMESYQRDILEKALRFYEGFAMRQSSEPEVVIDAARARNRVGEISLKLGRTQAAEAAFQGAIELMSSPYLGPQPRGPQTLAAGHGGLGKLFRETNRAKESEEALKRGIEILDPLVARYPETSEYRRDLAGQLVELGKLLTTARRLAGADAATRRALALLEQLARDQPAVVEHRSLLAEACKDLFWINRDTIGKWAEAEGSLKRASAVLEALAHDAPRSTRYQHELAGYHLALGAFLSEDRRNSEAEASYLKAASIAEKLMQDHPGLVASRREFVAAGLALVELLVDQSRAAEAEALIQRIGPVVEALVADHPENDEYRDWLVRLGTQRYSVLRGSRRAGEGEAAVRHCRSLLEKAAESRGADRTALLDQAKTHYQVGLLLSSGPPTDEFVAAATRSLANARTLAQQAIDRGAGNLDAARTALALYVQASGDLQSRIGHGAEAMRAYQQARDLYQSLAAANPSDQAHQQSLISTLGSINDLHSGAGRWDDSLESLEAILGISQKLLVADRNRRSLRIRLSRSLSAIGASLTLAGRETEALRAYEQDLNVASDLAAAEPKSLEARELLATARWEVGFWYAQFPRATEALEHLKRAMLFFQEVAEVGFKEHPAYRGNLGSTHFWIGNMQRVAGQREEALRSYEKARAVYQSVVDERPADVSHQLRLAETIFTRGGLEREMGKTNQALKSYSFAVEVLEKLALSEMDLMARRELVLCYAALGGLAEPLGEAELSRQQVPVRPYKDLAVSTLRRALSEGLSELGRRRRWHGYQYLADWQEADLASLYSRADFRELMMDLDFPEDPFGH